MTLAGGEEVSCPRCGTPVETTTFLSLSLPDDIDLYLSSQVSTCDGCQLDFSPASPSVPETVQGSCPACGQAIELPPRPFDPEKSRLGRDLLNAQKAVPQILGAALASVDPHRYLPCPDCGFHTEYAVFSGDRAKPRHQALAKAHRQLGKRGRPEKAIAALTIHLNTPSLPFTAPHEPVQAQLNWWRAKLPQIVPPPLLEVEVKAGDVLDQDADALICSANTQLNMSGGVNGAILRRGGRDVQQELRDHLKDVGSTWVEAGTVVRTGPGPLNVQSIFHAVGIDSFYASSRDLLKKTLVRALAMACAEGAETVSLSAIATGYGALSMEDFGIAVSETLETYFSQIRKVVVVLRKEKEVEVVRGIISARKTGEEDLPKDAAKPSDRQRLPMAISCEVLPLDWPFTQEELNRIRRGCIPETMDDKWFLVFESNRLACHRSWTGGFIFDVVFVREGDGARAVAVVVNREDYKSEGPEEDLRLVWWLIDTFLLDRN